MYHEHCEMCQQEIARMLKLKPKKESIAFVEVPPLNFSDIQRVNYRSILWTSLDDQLKWFVESPVQIRIVEGIVTQVKTRDQLRVTQ